MMLCQVQLYDFPSGFAQLRPVALMVLPRERKPSILALCFSKVADGSFAASRSWAVVRLWPLMV